jgi:hypothetical protein
MPHYTVFATACGYKLPFLAYRHLFSNSACASYTVLYSLPEVEQGGGVIGCFQDLVRLWPLETRRLLSLFPHNRRSGF